MKKIISILTIAFAAVGCTIDERPKLPDGRVSDLKIVVTPGEVQNTYLLRTNRTDVIGFWDLGNGNTASGVNSVTAEYPFPGDYTISLKAYGDNGRTNDVSVKLSVTTENLFLLNDPMYTYIAGEIGGEGKTWMLDAERQDHIGLFNPNNVSDRWGGVSPNGKAGCELYDDEATFILNSERGQAFGYVNNGKSSTLNNMTPAMELYNDGAWSATAYNLASTNDYIVACTPPSNMGWSLSQTGGRYYISFPSTNAGHGGYLFYFCGWNTQYEVRAISETHMKIFMWSTIDGKLSLRQLLLRTRETASNNDPSEWSWSKDEPAKPIDIRKKLLYILCAAALAAGCSDDDASSYYLDELVIDTANCLAEGSYVQGVEANDLCRIKIPYENAKGGTARISAPETNGLRIDAQEVTLVSGAGEATVAVKGTPLLLETSFLQLNVEYRAKTYLSSVEIAVLEDVDPSGTIEFEIDRTPLTGLTAPETIAFTVSPTMAAVVESGTTPDGLRVNVVSDPATGEGTVMLTPAANFLGGEVELTASFGARPPQVCKIRVSAFAAGEGTADAPYEVTSAAELEKIGYGFDKAFHLASDIVLDNNWTPAGTEAQPFTGSLDGNGRKITLALDRPAEDYVALFARVGAGAEVTNLTLDGSVTGRNYVSALAA